MGGPAFFLGIVKQSKANTVEVANGIKAELEVIRGILPLGVALDVAFDESVYVQKAIEEVWLTLAIAFGLVMVVIYLFLRDLRSTLIPMAAIPVSIVATFADPAVDGLFDQHPDHAGAGAGDWDGGG
jgi:multidrug efflux pump